MSAAEAAAAPEVPGLPAEAQAHALAILGAGDALARLMRWSEAQAYPGLFRVEHWQWVIYLVVIRGFRGRTTGATYAGIVARYALWCVGAEVDYRDIPLPMLDRWQKSLYVDRRNAGATRRQAVAAIRSFYRWRASRGGGQDCARDLEGPRRVNRLAKKYTTQQLRAMFHVDRPGWSPLTRQRNRVLMLVLLSTGMRREEVATLRLDQVELGQRNGAINVIGKGAKERLIPITGPVVDELSRWLVVRGELSTRDDTVFVRTVGRDIGAAMSVQSVEHVIKSVARAAGLPAWGVHRFRVTFATQLYDDGADIERIRIVMGHESIETTRKYLAVSQRMRDVRLNPNRQHEVLGTRPVGMPMWAKQVEDNRNG